MEARRGNPLRRYPTGGFISVWHFGLIQSKTRALNSPGFPPNQAGRWAGRRRGGFDP
jgi:hypothetical protein